MCENKKGDKCAINNGDCIGEFECERAKLLDEVLELKKYIERMKEPELKVIDANIALENAELKADNKHLNDLLDNALKEQEELREENERLKEENAKLNKMAGIFSARLCGKYRTTLQKIKAIAETYLTDCQGFKCEAMEEIMQKITKVEEE